MVSQNLSIVMPHSKSLLRTIRQRLSEPLYVSSIYLMGGTIVSSVFGFLFWLIAARLTTTSDVGLATAIISSIALLTGMFDCGLGPSLIYYASAKHQNPMGFIKTAIGFGWIVSSIVGISYLIGLPFWSPALVEIQQNYLITVIFVVFTTINFVLGLQDVAMLSLRKTQYVFWRNVACNTPPTLLLLVFYLFGAGYEII
ncbi:MAG: hypothetical protein B6242_08840 [Anaerolineaceae bacterium 4572_78]|nr:MAG: hypothetical protein B6242_08840 [Anaerolineaceae bacterium 4572_78]